MNLILVTVFAVASLSVFPTRIFGSSDSVEETPNVLPLSSSPKEENLKNENIIDIKSTDNNAEITKNGGELWEENDHEVLIRNERGANKNNNNSNGGGGGSNAGKKGNKNKQLNDKSKNQHQSSKRENSNNHKKQTGENIKDTNKNDKLQEQEQSSCRYVKSPWTECDTKLNTRSRTLTLKKGEEGCVQTRTIQKKCKKACRYEKGAWSECTAGHISRTDKLKSTSDASCQSTRVVTKNCNPGKPKGEKSTKEQRPGKNGNKDKGNRKSRA